MSRCMHKADTNSAVLLTQHGKIQLTHDVQGLREQKEAERGAAPQAAAATAVYLTPGQEYCLLPRAWLEVRHLHLNNIIVLASSTC